MTFGKKARNEISELYDEKSEKIRLNINGCKDRREIVAILADNGYKVKIIKEEISYFDHKYWLEIEK